MAYNRRNYYERVLEIQNITLELKKKYGSSQTWIFANVIHDRYKISKSTYDRYLTIAAAREIKKMEMQKNNS